MFQMRNQGTLQQGMLKGRQPPGQSGSWINVQGLEGKDYPPDHPMVQVSRAFMRMTPKDKSDFKLLFKSTEDF